MQEYIELMYMGIFIVTGYYALTILWVFYLAVMNLKRNRKKLTTPAKFWAYPTLVIGILLDAMVTLVFATVYFQDLPREWTLSERLTRYKDHRSGWKHEHAIWFGENFLDPFDPNPEGHI